MVNSKSIITFHISQNSNPKLTQLYTCDSQRPHIHFAIILPLIHGQNYFRCHPVWCSNKTVCRTFDACWTKIRCNVKDIKLQMKYKVWVTYVAWNNLPHVSPDFSQITLEFTQWGTCTLTLKEKVLQHFLFFPTLYTNRDYPNNIIRHLILYKLSTSLCSNSDLQIHTLVPNLNAK